MKYSLFIIVFIWSFQWSFAQEEKKNDSIGDTDYKEDQFYVGVTYNLLGKKPSNLSQSGFSSGFHLGFIKDIPINTRRNVAVGIGLGLSSNSFNQNMLIGKDESNDYVYSILNDSDISYNKNKFTMYLVELPLEFRWRTSTTTEYKFWRIYTGLKLGYVIANSSKFIGDPESIKNSGIKDFNNFQFGLNITAGYNTWNVHFYYALNSIFKSGTTINNESLDMNTVKIGLMFYIL